MKSDTSPPLLLLALDHTDIIEKLHETIGDFYTQNPILWKLHISGLE